MSRTWELTSPVRRFLKIHFLSLHQKVKIADFICERRSQKIMVRLNEKLKIRISLET